MPTFSIINTETNEALEGITFDDGGVASSFVKKFNETSAIKYKVRKNPEPAVPDRHGYENGVYRRTPWHSERWRLSSLWDHVIDHETDGKLIRFIDPDTLQWTQAKPGRFLTRFFSSKLTGTDIERWTKRVDAKPPQLLFTRDPDVIQDIYERGPSSCMSYAHRNSGFRDLPEHPTRVYASPDLELCYAVDEDGVPFARALVWREKKIFGRPYAGYKRAGDNSYNNDPAFEVPFLDALNNAGLKRGQLEGARIRKIPYGADCWVMPYLDDDMGVSDHGDGCYLFIEQEGPITGDNTCGYTDRVSGCDCERCGTHVEDRDDMCTVIVEDDNGERTEDWCSHCVHEHTFYTDDRSYVSRAADIEVVEVAASWGSFYVTLAGAYRRGYVERGGRWFQNHEVADKEMAA